MISRIFLLTCVLALFACGQKPENTGTATGPATSASLPEGFQEFYDRFHKDSLYQMEHIVWPLSGLTGVQIDSSHTGSKPTQWQRDKWVMHRVENLNSKEFERSFEVVTDQLLIERIRTRTGGFSLERRWSKQMNGEWTLIYYADMISK